MDTLLTINGQAISIEDALGWSTFLSGPDLREFASKQIAISQAAKARGLDATGAEVNALFVELRHMMRLESSEALRQWMTETGLTVGAMTEACTQLILRRKLRETITPEDVAGHYAEHRPDYDRAMVYRILVEDQDVAQEFRALVMEEDDSFYLLALEHSIDDDTAPMGGYLGDLARSDLEGEAEASVFGAAPGDVIGPLKTDGGWELLLVHDLGTIPLEDVADIIREQLFEEMIDTAVSRARIE